MRSLEALGQRLEHNIHICSYKKHCSDVSNVSDALISASFIGSFAWTAIFLF